MSITNKNEIYEILKSAKQTMDPIAFIKGDKVRVGIVGRVIKFGEGFRAMILDAPALTTLQPSPAYVMDETVIERVESIKDTGFYQFIVVDPLPEPIDDESMAEIQKMLEDESNDEINNL